MDLAALIYHRPAFLDGQWWLPLTAQVVHFNTAHALANGTAAALIACVFYATIAWQRQCAIVLGSAAAVAMVVVLDAGCDVYAGASGALHGWLAGAALMWSAGASRWCKAAGLALLLGLAAKLGLQHAVALTVWGFPVYTAAHEAGALGGALVALGLLWRRPEQAQHAERG